MARAGHSLITGLMRIPAAPHRLSQHLFDSLVKPVALYGVELFTLGVADDVQFRTLQISLWRCILKIGGRSPQDVTTELMGVRCLTIECRVRRVGLLLKLLNSPADSW